MWYEDYSLLVHLKDKDLEETFLSLKLFFSRQSRLTTYASVRTWCFGVLLIA